MNTFLILDLRFLIGQAKHAPNMKRNEARGLERVIGSLQSREDGTVKSA